MSLALTCLLCCGAASALELRAYDSSVHDRFVGFPESPAFNPTFLLDSDKLVGVGWDPQNPQKQFALVSRCHVLFAAHAAPAIGSRIAFLNRAGTIIERRVARTQKVLNPTSSTSDVLLITLSSPISSEEGIEPLPYLNLPSEADYIGLPLIVLGSQAKAGEGSLIDFRTINVNWIVSRTFRFDYNIGTGDANDARLAEGDSGSPTLTTVNGEKALLGLHLATSTVGGVQSNFDAFIPHYAPQIDALIAADGFRMRPLNAAPTEIHCTPSVTSPQAEQGEALNLEYRLENRSSSETGNVEAEIHFPEHAAPDQIIADGWVLTSEGNCWKLRRSVLGQQASSAIQLKWNAAPMVASLEPEIRWVSDTSDAQTLITSIPLVPGFSSWAAALSEKGQLDDPDKDGVSNIIEYALGSNPLSGSTILEFGSPPRPTFSVQDGIASYSHPERTDKAERGLSYLPEWSPTLSEGSWSGSLPTGFSTSTTSYFPGVPGFTKRTIRWPLQPSHRFIRLNISESGENSAP
ncbi:hypothetical protein [Haloferula sp.]|uniref:hypothetical protein n=1 Tax=Haloferula sp. TaxID=2497595 RepID=UPI003C790F27